MHETLHAVWWSPWLLFLSDTFSIFQCVVHANDVKVLLASATEAHAVSVLRSYYSSSRALASAASLLFSFLFSSPGLPRARGHVTWECRITSTGEVFRLSVSIFSWILITGMLLGRIFKVDGNMRLLLYIFSFLSLSTLRLFETVSTSVRRHVYFTYLSVCKVHTLYEERQDAKCLSKD